MTRRGPDAPPFLNAAFLERLESISEPALVYQPGGRVVAVNRAAARLFSLPFIWAGVTRSLQQVSAVRANGRPVAPGDLPYVRALRGEVVDQGERVDVELPDGSIHRAVVTSTPIVVDGTVVAALSIWHDFDEDMRELGEEPKQIDGRSSREG